MWFPARSFRLLRHFILMIIYLACAESLYAIVYPPLSSFLYGNSSVNQVGQTSLVSGSGLPYRYLVPKNYNPAIKYPVILLLHGSSEAGTNNTSQLTAGSNSANGALALVSTGFPDNQTNYPCFFVAPQCDPFVGWVGTQAQLQAILATLNTHYSIDTDRVCLTGISLGALASWGLVNAMPNTFSCMVPQSGGGSTSVLNAMSKIPVWIFHSENDPNVSCNSSDTTVTTLRNRGFPVIFTRYMTGDHAIWSVAYQHGQLLAWIFAQRRSQPMQGVPALNIATTALGLSPLQISGTAATTASIPITRIGSGNSLSGTIPTGTDAVTYGDMNFSANSFTFTAAHVGHRLAIIRPSGGEQNAFRTTITGFVNAHTVTVDRTYAAASGRTYAIYAPGDSAYVNPAAGTGAADWTTWSLSAPLNAGTSNTQVMMEMSSGSSVLGGSTTMNQTVALTYAVPTGDVTAPAISLSAPAGVPFTTILNQITLLGVASDNVAVSSITWKTDRGNTGTASGTTAWSAANVPLSTGPNIVSVTAKDAKNNFSMRTFTINYTPAAGGLANWKTAKFGASATDPAIAGNTADPDGDGVGNLVEYALSGQPLAASPASQPVLIPSANGLQLAFTRLSPTDVTYTVEASVDLTAWSPLCTLTSNEVWTGTATVSETGSGATRNVTVQDTAGLPSSGGRFLRLKISTP